VQGPEDAPVTLVEYGDYECPYCGAAYPIVKRLQKKMGKDLRFVFRNFPLAESHPHALAAARAAEAAGLQTKFWEMHDLLYENQTTLEARNLKTFAQTLELDIDQWAHAFTSGEEITARLEEDWNSGVRSGVNGTPTFFINGVRHDASFTYPVLLAALQRPLARAPQRRRKTPTGGK
jgi:protein-disulfide isomerase